MDAYERYCEIRDSLGYKDADIVKRTGITKSTFSSWKAGRYVPKDDKMKKIADVLGVTLDFLRYGDDEQKNDGEGYYTNPETAKVAQELFDDPNLKMLFDAARNARPEDLKMAADLLRRFKETNPDG